MVKQLLAFLLVGKWVKPLSKRAGDYRRQGDFSHHGSDFCLYWAQQEDAGAKKSLSFSVKVSEDL